MKTKRILALLLAGIMACSLLAGCSDETSDNTGSDKDNAATSEGGSEDNGNSSANQDQGQVHTNVPSQFTIQKVGSTDIGGIGFGKTAINYMKDSKHGIMSFDGKQNTGAIYLDCSASGNYFKVRTTELTSATDLKAVNCYGVVDATGKEIIPKKYAVIDSLSDRYAKVCEATEITTNKDEALMYLSSSLFSVTASDDDTFYKGVWYVYDLTSGQMVSGATGTNATSVYATEDLLTYTTDDNKRVTVNSKGQILPQNVSKHDNGSYAIVEKGKGTMYDANGNILFTYSDDDYVPSSWEDGSYVARKYDNGKTDYAIMDNGGKILFKGMSDRPTVRNELVMAGDKVYNLKGEVVFQGDYTIINRDESTKKVWLLASSNAYALIDVNGTVLMQAPKNDDTYASVSGGFYAHQQKNGEYCYYSFKDKDFTLPGNDISGWLVSIDEADDSCSLVDVKTGEKILTGYRRYSGTCTADSITYIYAAVEGGGYDIYQLTLA